MAGNCFRRLWSWISIAILSGRVVFSNEQNSPCSGCFADQASGDEDLRSETEVTVFLRDGCKQRTNLTDIQDFFDRSNLDARVTLVPLSLSCETKTRGLDALLRVLGEGKTRALVAALDSPMCEVTAKLANLWRLPLFTWTCPSTEFKEEEVSPIIRLSPSLPLIAKALANMLMHLQWKTVALIGTDREPWTSLGGALSNAIRTSGAVLRYRITLPYRAASLQQIRAILRPMYNISRRVTVLCLPVANDDQLTSRVLAELDVARGSSEILRDTITVIVHTKDDDLFLPEANGSPPRPASASASASSGLGRTASTPAVSLASRDASEAARSPSADHRTARGHPEDEQSRKYVHSRFFPPENISSAFLETLSILTPLDPRYDATTLYEGTERYAVPNSLDRLNETLRVLMHDNSSINAFNNKIYTYVLLEWRVNAWNPIMIAEEREGKLHVQKLSTNAAAFRNTNDTDFSKCNAPLDTGNADVDCAENHSSDSTFRIAQIVAIVLGSLLMTVVALMVAIIIRKRLLKRRMSKGPYKIILTTSDFVFPQVPQVDSRRVDEGIETMLCCWLQQLQEFGGPEVEKPDLLQLGSVSSLRPYLRGSTGNLARHNFFKDPRARYNGDLVQLKELPAQGTFELKNKAMDVLVTIHGLRHENLNPLIGCLNEPTRPCLVYEYCSRGSLEDVLVQDEIKLDWSFRLSLLTDLVRGMRYLHGTPVRVHGYLTSRNCVIDARWVLKVTDYGLPAFYEAQNIVGSAKTARDLLWTAPELLRHPNLRKKGTQAGDVYSFGIIMQEVVVRGEPFCMLALSPEDIIEKVMKPPPLIRPSVSKGAAPPEAINIMRQCWAEAADMRPDFDDVHDRFKKLNHGRKVNFVDTMFQMLEKYSNNLEELIRERTEQLDMEKKKTEQLLNRMLPSSVADKLKLGMPVDPEEFREVTIYFSDIVGFTSISAHSTPFQVVDLLNDLYTCFDATINAYTVYKVETIGDAYMVVGGCPVRIPDHASQIATMALDLLHQSGKFKVRHLPKTQLRLRIGLHTGPCCAGVVGLTMPRYCLFGDTVNTASRMESTGAPWRIHLSQATRDRLLQVGGYLIEYRGPTEVKGKGKMPTYWLLGKQGFDKELPTPSHPPPPPPLGFLMLLSVAILPPPSGKTMGKSKEKKSANATEKSRGGNDVLAATNTRSETCAHASNTCAPPHEIEQSLISSHADPHRRLNESLIAENFTNGETVASPNDGRVRAHSSDDETLMDSQERERTEKSRGEDAKLQPVDGNAVEGEGEEEEEEEEAAAAAAFVQERTETSPAGSVAVAVHDEKKMMVGGSRSPQRTADTGRVVSSKEGTSGEDRADPTDATKGSDKHGDPQPSSLGPSSMFYGEATGGSAFGASTSSLTSISSSATIPYRPAPARHRRIAGYIDENDLSTPYNHYRCLSPNEHHGRSTGNRFLKRQFSLDRPDEPVSIGFTEHGSQQLSQQQQQTTLRTTPRIYKQNSAGAANDLERIEEVPSTPAPHLQHYRQAASVSLSVESLTLR